MRNGLLPKNVENEAIYRSTNFDLFAHILPAILVSKIVSCTIVFSKILGLKS